MAKLWLARLAARREGRTTSDRGVISRVIRRASALLVLLPVILIGTVTGHVLLNRLQAPQSYDALGVQLDQMIPALMQEDHVSGVAIVLVHQGVSSVKSYGLADVAKQSPVGPDTLFQAASLSKPVTAWGVMRLVEEGRLDLDAPVSQYLTRWQPPPSRFDASGVTVRRLLSHTAGLSDTGYLGYDTTAELPSL